ncbi:Cof-type HAD-IIB family hydrolase [uncultured Sphingomonas sp.]|uniref:Cof-type HAD-IIB family hydrolase n=1 Tax=uncultured Sphingomonas sp. TaxID=158754 RepID=UPI0035CAF32B
MSDVPVRLVVSDVDGTLVRKDKSLSPQNIAAAHRLRVAGIPMTLISARPVSGVLPLITPMVIDIPLAAFNGGTIFRPDGSIVAAHRVPPEVAAGIFALAEDAAVDRWVFADDRWFATTVKGVHVEHERLASNQEPVIRDRFEDLYDRIDKITFVSDDADTLKDLAGRATAIFGGQATIGQSQTYYLDVTSIHANKGDGVKAIAGLLGIPLDAIAVIGDMDNDTAMFAVAGLSIAMGQSPDRVKRAARLVTSSNDEDGVAHAIDAIILPRVGAQA